MGFLSDLRTKASSFPGADDARNLWRQTFGAISKEDGHRQQPIPGGSHSRSASTTSNASVKRLLQALRSLAPGGWSDDRWEQSKHFTGIQYVCVHRTGEQLAQSEFQVFEKDSDHPDGKRPVPSDHPLIRLLSKPNQDDSFGDLLYAWNLQMDLTGMALTWMVPNKLGIPYELYPIPTATAIPQPAVNPDYPDGFYRIQPVYPYGPWSTYPTPNSAVGAAIPSQWMLRFKYTHPLLRYEGHSPLTALRLHIDEVEAMDRSRWYNMKRTINPSAVLNFDEMEGAQPLSDEEIERLHAEFENQLMGPENVGRLFVGSPGSKLEPWGNRPVDMDYQSGWDQLVGFVMGGFGITKPAAGMIEDSSYSTLFATLKQLHLLTLAPKCNRIARQLTRHVAPFFGDNLIIEIRCQRIDDHEVKKGKLDQLIGAKAITKNELRKELDMPLTKEKWGDEIAGTESQQQQPSMPGQPGDPQQPQEFDMGLEGLMGFDEGEDEIEQQRPDTGTLGEGALGPRKGFSLNGINGKHRRKRCPAY